MTTSHHRDRPQFPGRPGCNAGRTIALVEIERQTVTSSTRTPHDIIAHTGRRSQRHGTRPGWAFTSATMGFGWRREHGLLRPIIQASDYTSGSIQRVIQPPADDLLFDNCTGHKLRRPGTTSVRRPWRFLLQRPGKKPRGDRDHGACTRPRDAPNCRGRLPILTRTGLACRPTAAVYVRRNGNRAPLGVRHHRRRRRKNLVASRANEVTAPVMRVAMQKFA